MVIADGNVRVCEIPILVDEKLDVFRERQELLALRSIEPPLARARAVMAGTVEPAFKVTHNLRTITTKQFG
jgi:hypothetical protein